MWWFWDIAGRTEGTALLRAALDGAPRAEPALRQQALFAVGNLVTECAPEESKGYLMEALHIAQARHDDVASIPILNDLSSDEWWLGNHRRAIALSERLVYLARGQSDASLSAQALVSFGQLLAENGSITRAEAVLDEALALNAAKNDIWLVGQISAVRGLVAYLERDNQRARSLLTEALASTRSSSIETWICSCSVYFAWLALDENELSDARSHLRRVLRALLRSRELKYAGSALQSAAACALLQRRPIRAAVLNGAAMALREAGACQRTMPIERERSRDLSAAITAALPAPELTEASARGAAMSVEIAAAYALDDDAE